MHNMTKLMLVAVCAMAVMVSCKNKGTANAGGGKDSSGTVLDSIIEENDTTPMPMFLMGEDGRYALMLYWSHFEEPKKSKEYPEYFEEEHRSWVLQEMFRRNKALYTNMLTDGKFVKIKFIDEVLKDPDGGTPSIGIIHGCREIPSLCARFDFATPKDKKKGDGNEWGTVIVTDGYLKTRKFLPITVFEDTYYSEAKPLPASVVMQLEKVYGMKASRSVLMGTFGDDYTYGSLQFKGEFKNGPKEGYDEERKCALALDVLVKGDKVYVNEQYGSMYSETDYSWNVDDEGQYAGCCPLAAFEGPKGLELCYYRGAPESQTVGMFYLREGKLIEQEYAGYYNSIDEQIPVWKKDFETMEKMYHADESGDDDVTLVKWAHPFINSGNEWIWLRDKDDKNGAFFIREDGKLTLVAIENPRLNPLTCEKNGISYLKLSGPAGGPSWYEEIYAYKSGKRLWRLNVLKVYGEIDDAYLNEKSITKEQAQAYLDQIPQGEKIIASFTDIK